MYDIDYIDDYHIIKNRGNSFFFNDALRKVSAVYLGWLVFAFLFSSAAYISRNIGMAVIVYFIIFSVHLYHRFRCRQAANVLAPDVLFIVVYTLFHMSYVTFYAMGILPYLNEILIFKSSIPKALFIVNLGLVSFILGYELISGRHSENEPFFPRPTLTWTSLGSFIMLLALFMHFLVLAAVSSEYQAYGYKALQNIDSYVDSEILILLWRNCIYIMVLGLVIHTIASSLRNRKLFSSKFALILVLTYFVLVILEGDRGPIIQMGIPLLLAKHYLVKRLSFKVLLLLFFGALFLYTALGVARQVVLDPKAMVDEYKRGKESGLVNWYTPFVSMGGSFLVVNIVAHEIPDVEPYWNGVSWLDGIIHIVPFFQGLLLKKGYYSTDGWLRWPPSTWITTTYFGENASGRAFTIAAEGYLNFGYLGVIIELMFFGMATRWLTVKFSLKRTALSGCIMLICYGIFVFAIRNHVGNMFNKTAQLFIIMFLIDKVLGNEEEPYQEELP